MSGKESISMWQAVRLLGQAVMGKKGLVNEIGVSGTEIYSGRYFDDDVNEKWDDDRRVDIVDEMLYSDPVIQSIESAITLPILSAEPRIEPASDDNIDLRIAEQVELDFLKNPDLSYRDWIRDVLNYLFYGFVVLEKVFEVDAGRIRWKKFAYRKPETIDQWHVTRGGDLEAITQCATGPEGSGFGDFRIEPITGIDGKVFHMAYKQQGDNYRGRSILRPAWRSFEMKKDRIIRMAIQAERGASGIPWAHFENGTPNDTDLTRIKKVLQNLRSGAKSWGYSWKGIDVDLKGGKDFFGSDLVPGLRYHDQQMVAAVMGQFLEQGKEQTGARAMQESNIGLFMDNEEAIANDIEDVFNNGRRGMQHLKQYVDLNFANVTEYPRFRIGKINSRDLNQISNIISTFKNAGMPLVDADWLYLREQVGLPEVEIEELQEEIERRRSAVPQMQPAPVQDDE